MANLATRADRRRMKIERVTRKRLRREFGRYASEAASNPKALDLPTQEHAERLAKILGDAYDPSIRLGVELAEDQLRKSRKQDATTEALIDRLLAEWVGQIAFTRATSLSAASRLVAQEALESAIAQGFGERATAELIRDAVGNLSRGRSLTIARTETHAATMNSGVAAAEDLGATEKEWVAIEDDRVRNSHRDANSQTVALKDKFNVGGAALRFPGDPDAGAPGETINCRCALAYI